MASIFASFCLLGLWHVRQSRKKANIGAVVALRDLLETDKSQWLVLWKSYLSFYMVAEDPDVTNSTWERLVDHQLQDMKGVIATNDIGEMVGFAHYVLSHNTWSVEKGCYLEDLFVKENCRGQQIGRKLIQALADMVKLNGWSRLFWVTTSDNIPAQQLYNSIAKKTDLIQYRMI